MFVRKNGMAIGNLPFFGRELKKIDEQVNIVKYYIFTVGECMSRFIYQLIHKVINSTIHLYLKYHPMHMDKF